MSDATPGGAARSGAPRSPGTPVEDTIAVASGEGDDATTRETLDQSPSPKRPSRTLKPSIKVREAMQSIEDATTTSRRIMSGAMRPTATKGTSRLGDENGANSQTGTGNTSLQILLGAISEQRDMISEQRDMIREQRNMICELREVVSKQQNAFEELHRPGSLSTGCRETPGISPSRSGATKSVTEANSQPQLPVFESKAPKLPTRGLIHRHVKAAFTPDGAEHGHITQHGHAAARPPSDRRRIHHFRGSRRRPRHPRRVKLRLACSSLSPTRKQGLSGATVADGRCQHLGSRHRCEAAEAVSRLVDGCGCN